MRNCGRTPCFGFESAAAAVNRCKIGRAARHARNGASSSASGAPNSAMMPSPVNPCPTPPCSRTASGHQLRKARISVKAASSPGPFGESREADHVGEQDGDLPAFRFHLSPATHALDCAARHWCRLNSKRLFSSALDTSAKLDNHEVVRR